LFIFLLCFSCIKSEDQKKQDEENSKELVKQADELYWNCDFNTALKLYLNAEKLGFKDPVIYFKIGFSYDKGPNDIKKADKYYAKAIKNITEEKDSPFLAAAYFHSGYLASLRKDTTRKQEYFKIAHSKFKKLLEQNKMRAIDYFRLGYIYYDKEDFNTARTYFNKAIKLFKKNNPGHIYYTLAYYNIGVTYFREEDYITSLWYGKQALKNEPDSKLFQDFCNKAREKAEHEK